MKVKTLNTIILIDEAVNAFNAVIIGATAAVR